jgi:putative transposase
MQRLQAFKYELLPNSQQERQMRRFAGSCRFVYNKALALQKERHEQGQKKLGCVDLSFEPKESTDEIEKTQEVPGQFVKTRK